MAFGAALARCGIRHWGHTDLELPAGVAVKRRGGKPTLPPQASTCSFRVLFGLIEDRVMRMRRGGYD